MRLIPTLGISCALLLLCVSVASAATQDWHCLCYLENYKGSTVHATACRASIKACKSLEKRVAVGSKAVVKGSMFVPCTQVKGAHPSSALGLKEAWLPSKRPGATWTPARCALGPVLSESQLKVKRASQKSDVKTKTPSGWALHTYVSPNMGTGWLEAIKGSLTAQYRHFPVFGAGCSTISSDWNMVKKSSTGVIGELIVGCAGPGEDNIYTQGRSTLVHISSDSPPVFKTLWSRKAHHFANYSLGETKSEEYTFNIKGGELHIMGHDVVCKDLYMEDTERYGKEKDHFASGRCTKKQIYTETIKGM